MVILSPTILHPNNDRAGSNKIIIIFTTQQNTINLMRSLSQGTRVKNLFEIQNIEEELGK